METIQVKVRIPTGDAKVLDGLAGSLFTRNDMASMLLQAAVEAVKKGRDKLKFPPVLTVEGGSEVVERIQLNEVKSRK